MVGSPHGTNADVVERKSQPHTSWWAHGASRAHNICEVTAVISPVAVLYQEDLIAVALPRHKDVLTQGVLSFPKRERK